MDATRISGLRILLVDDNEPLLRAMGLLLRAIGHSVAAAGGVCEALSILRCQPIDLLISDIDLGSGSGLDLIRNLRRTSEIPAIAMSGQPDMAGPSLASGFQVFLDKPVSRQSLQRTIGLVVAKAPAAEDDPGRGPLPAPILSPLPPRPRFGDEPEASKRRTGFIDPTQHPAAGRG